MLTELTLSSEPRHQQRLPACIVPAPLVEPVIAQPSAERRADGHGAAVDLA